MIAKKVFVSDGINKRFLSDFIIRSEQFTRVYNYVYDPGGIAGDIDPASGLFIRTTDAPTSDDLQTIDKWDLVDNSISFYISPHTGSKVWIEVATTAEEFGDTLIQPTVAQAEAARDIAVAKALLTDADATATAADVVLTHADVVLTHADVVLTHADAASTAADAIATAADAAATAADVLSTNADAASTAADAIATAADAASTAADVLATAADVVSSGTNATNAQLKAWEAEAFRLTAQSYATEAEDVLVNVVTSDGDGTFTYTPQAGVYSALHWDAKAILASVSAVQKAGDTMTGNLEAPSMSIGGEFLSAFGFKNKLINGMFYDACFQRGTTQSINDYGSADRWGLNLSGATGTMSKVSNTGVMATYDIKSPNRIRVNTTVANDNTSIYQKIEDVRTLQGKNATISFWVYNAKGTQTLFIQLQQVNSGYTTVTTSDSLSIPTGWTKIERTIAIPAITNGTVIDVHSYLQLFIGIADNSLVDFSICDVQLEEGTVATPFEQRPVGLELNLCQRYYQVYGGVSPYTEFAMVFATSTTIWYGVMALAVPMRVNASVVWSGNFGANGGAAFTGAAFGAVTELGRWGILGIKVTTSGMTVGVGSRIGANNDATAKVTLDAEL